MKAWTWWLTVLVVNVGLVVGAWWFLWPHQVSGAKLLDACGRVTAIDGMVGASICAGSVPDQSGVQRRPFALSPGSDRFAACLRVLRSATFRRITGRWPPEWDLSSDLLLLHTPRGVITLLPHRPAVLRMPDGSLYRAAPGLDGDSLWVMAVAEAWYPTTAPRRGDADKGRR